MAKGQNNPPIQGAGQTVRASKSEDHFGIRRAELLQIVCALVSDQDTTRSLTRETIVDEAKQYLKLIDNECP